MAKPTQHPVVSYMLALEQRKHKPSKLQQAASSVGRRMSGLQVVMNAINKEKSNER